jgi:DNA-binding NtrC family response regulator
VSKVIAGEAMAEKARILIVDDEPKICEFLAILLGREGYQADSAFNATEAGWSIEDINKCLSICDYFGRRLNTIDVKAVVNDVEVQEPEFMKIPVKVDVTVLKAKDKPLGKRWTT